MPLYEYECEICGTRFERFQSIRDEPVRQCPECSGKVHKVLHAAGIIFKGSGWYSTDSRKSTSSAVTSDTQASTAGAKIDKPAESAAETKTETKSETKAETKSTKTETK